MVNVIHFNAYTPRARGNIGDAAAVARAINIKIALVNPPFGTVSPLFQNNSIAIWNCEVARRLSKYCIVIVYAKKIREFKQNIFYEGVHYKYISDFLV